MVAPRSPPPPSVTVRAAVEREGLAACRLALDLTVHQVWGRATGLHAQRVILPGRGQAAAAGWEDLLAGRLHQVVGAPARLWGSLTLGERHTGRHTGSNQARLFRAAA